MEPEDRQKKPLTDPTYGGADFKVQLLGGSLRWLATLLAAAALGILIYLLVSKEEPVIRFPIHLKGKAALWTIIIVFVVWVVLAILNWRSWIRKSKS